MHGVDLSNDEIAKSHLRYMIGGRSDVENERLFRFGKLYLPSCVAEPSVDSYLTVPFRVPGEARCPSKVPALHPIGV
jgi:hypothetical protein